MKYVFIFAVVLYIAKFNKCFPHDSSVISKYARVAVWGNNKTEPSTSRNIKSGHVWNHRLDPKSISPTTKKKNPSVAYQYPVYQRPASKGDRKTEHVPGIGEVIVAEAQDRFESRPLFAYRNKNGGPTYLPPPPPRSSSGPAASTFSPPVTPAIMPATKSDAVSYNSPFSSYNPPVFKPDDTSNGDLYPPNGDDSPKNSGKPTSMEDQDNEQPKPPKESIRDPYVSLGPPLASYDNHDHSHPDYEAHDVPEDPMAMYKYQEGMPQHPPKSVDDVYYPPDFPKDQIAHDGMGGHDDGAMKYPHEPMDMQPEEHDDQNNMMPPEDESKSNGHDAPPDDHLPPHSPPSHDYEPEHGHAFPQYLYDQHHYDHHVYEEIPHTTMAPAKEDKRVSSTNYSYYYLGRKLWYIPLYFSVYFIIYVTVLILKSIARHKVRLKYRWYEHDTSAAKHARSMNLDDIRHEELTNLHRNVSTALQNATAKFDSVLAMK